jgi:hypothetical protein
MSLQYVDPDNSKIIVLEDGDRSRHIFTKEDPGKLKKGSNLELAYLASTSTDPNAYYIVTDKSKLKISAPMWNIPFQKTS